MPAVHSVLKDARQKAQDAMIREMLNEVSVRRAREKVVQMVSGLSGHQVFMALAAFESGMFAHVDAQDDDADPPADDDEATKDEAKFSPNVTRYGKVAVSAMKDILATCEMTRWAITKLNNIQEVCGLEEIRKIFYVTFGVGPEQKIPTRVKAIFKLVMMKRGIDVGKRYIVGSRAVVLVAKGDGDDKDGDQVMVPDWVQGGAYEVEYDKDDKAKPLTVSHMETGHRVQLPIEFRDTWAGQWLLENNFSDQIARLVNDLSGDSIALLPLFYGSPVMDVIEPIPDTVGNFQSCVLFRLVVVR